MEAARKNKRKILFILAVMFFGIVIIFGSLLYYKYEENIIRNEKYFELRAIAELKIGQIVQWQKEKIYLLQLITENGILTESIEKLLSGSGNTSLDTVFSEALAAVKNNQEINNVMVVTTGLKILYSLDSSQSRLNPFVYDDIIMAAIQKKVFFTDLYIDDISRKIQINAVAPFLNKENNSKALLVLCIDPGIYLYPLIQSWPVPGKSAETLIVKKAGDSVVFLNELRYIKNTALSLKIPMNRKEVPAIQAVSGYEGIIQGIDYRGVSVLAHTGKVPGTNWFMVAKVDSAEIFAELYYRAVVIGILTVVVLFIFGFSQALFFNSRQRAILAEGKLKLETAIRASNTGLWDWNLQTDRIFFSPEWKQQLGYGEDEIGDSPSEWTDRVHPEDFAYVVSTRDSYIKAPWPSYEITYRFRHKNGSYLWILERASLVYDNNRQPVRMLGSHLDITRLKNYENEQEVTIALLHLINQSKNTPDLLGSIIGFFQIKSGFESVRIRLKKGNDYPFFDTGSFSPESKPAGDGFYGNLCTKQDTRETIPVWECMCGKVILGHSDPGNPLFTAKGSFWTNSLKNLPAQTLGETIWHHMTSYYGKAEYQSIGIFALRSGNECLGLLQLNDRRENMFTPQLLALWERFADYLAVALSKFIILEALKISEEKLHLTMNAVGAGIWEWDLRTNENTWSDEIWSLYGIKAGSCKPSYNAWFNTVFPGDRLKVQQVLLDAVENSTEFNIEWRVQTDKSRVRWLFSHGTPVLNAERKAVKYLGIVIDNTLLKESEKEIELKNELLHLTGEMGKIGGWEFDTVTLEGTWTDEMARIHDLDTGRRVNAQLGVSVYSGEHRKKIEEAIIEAVEFARPYDLELEMISFKGKYKWVRTMGLPVVEGGKVVKIRGILQDITERKLNQEALRKSEEKYRNLFYNAEVGMFRTEKDGSGYIEVNDKFTELLGYTREELVQYPTTFNWVNPEISRTIINILREKGTLSGFETTVKRKDGSVCVMLVSCRIFPGEEKKSGMGGMIEGSCIDITDRKKAEEELKKKNEELTRFIYTVSHDLKSPLVTIKSFTSFLKTDIKKEDELLLDRDIDFINKAADKMGNLLDELLELSRIGRKDNPRMEVPLQQIVQEALVLTAGRINEKKITVSITDEPVILFGSPERLAALYQNLLDNAAKFMGNQPSPLIEVGVQQDRGTIVLFVRDNGSGIDPRHSHKLFGLFEKLDEHSEGTGIGLALVKRIVDVHNGNIWFESAGPGKGATFYFTLEKTRIEKIEIEKTILVNERR